MSKEIETLEAIEELGIKVIPSLREQENANKTLIGRIFTEIFVHLFWSWLICGIILVFTGTINAWIWLGICGAILIPIIITLALEDIITKQQASKKHSQESLSDEG